MLPLIAKYIMSFILIQLRVLHFILNKFINLLFHTPFNIIHINFPYFPYIMQILKD